ncbi:hypothetical protein EPO33_03510 [Patescibacteria group bacterium]|nr:MAG: hypothetical protein EPO33_03510 [Patescibacteria group bacterium]
MTRRRVVDTAAAAAAPVSAEAPTVKKTEIVIPRSGIMGWVAAEVLTTHPDLAAHVAADARIRRAAVGPEWRKDIPEAGTLAPVAYEERQRAILVGVCPGEGGLDPKTLLASPDYAGLTELPKLLAGDPTARDPLFGTFPGTLSETVQALWVLAEAGVYPAAEAEAACRFLARAALGRFRAGNVAPRDMNVPWLRSWSRQPGTPWLHECILEHAGQHLDMGRRAAARDWLVGFGRIIPAATPQGTIRVAVCHSTSPYLADWLFDTEAPNVVLRLEDGGFFCRADKNSGITLHAAVAAWRRAALGRPPTEEEEDALEQHGRPFGTPIDFWRDDLTAGNKMLANPHLPAVAIDPAKIVEMLIASFAPAAEEW